MEEKELDLSCPCTPKCPNYGKCRQCIAAHAKFYTVPHCIKKMQEDMKKKHLHPSNPHMDKTLTERIEEYYEKEPGAHLRTVAEALKITEWQLLDASPNAIAVPVADLDTVWAELEAMDRVMLHLDTGSTVLQLTVKLPKAIDMKGMKVLKSESGDVSLTSLIFAGSLYSIFLVRESLYGGKESLSVAFVGEDERISLSVYLRRSDENSIEKASKERFEALWSKYSK